MLRLSPSHPPLWHTASGIRFGVDDALRIDDVEPWHLVLADALRVGLPDAMLERLARLHGAAAGEASALVDRLRGALARPRPPVGVTLEVHDGVVRADGDSIRAALQIADVAVTERSASDAHPQDPGPVVLLVASRLVDPRRAARLLAAGVAHLPVELTGDTVSVGPLVRPGTGPCLACRHAWRAERDAAWPTVAAQLLVREPVPTDGALLLEAASSARAMLAGTIPPERSVLLSVERPRSWRSHRAHPQCSCASPSGTATADDRDDPTSATTTATATAVPA